MPKKKNEPKKPKPKKRVGASKPTRTKKSAAKPKSKPILSVMDRLAESVEDLPDEVSPDLDDTDVLTLAEYLSNGMNGTKAWMMTHPGSSYNAASVSFYRWLRKAKISSEIKRIQNEML